MITIVRRARSSGSSCDCAMGLVSPHSDGAPGKSAEVVEGIEVSAIPRRAFRCLSRGGTGAGRGVGGRT